MRKKRDMVRERQLYLTVTHMRGSMTQENVMDKELTGIE